LCGGSFSTAPLQDAACDSSVCLGNDKEHTGHVPKRLFGGVSFLDLLLADVASKKIVKRFCFFAAEEEREGVIPSKAL
jgi:hypothetical protein